MREITVTVRRTCSELDCLFSKQFSYLIVIILHQHAGENYCDYTSSSVNHTSELQCNALQRHREGMHIVTHTHTHLVPPDTRS